jgi:hypothetical protein
MSLAQAAPRPLLRASDHYLVMLGIILLGYALLGNLRLLGDSAALYR